MISSIRSMGVLVLALAAGACSPAPPEERVPHEIVGGYTIDLPASFWVRRNEPHPVGSEPQLLVVMAGEGALPVLLTIDARPELDRDFASLSAASDNDLPRLLMAATGSNLDQLQELTGSPTDVEIVRAPGGDVIVRMFLEIGPPTVTLATGGGVAFVLRPEDSFRAIFSFKPGTASGNALREAIATIGPGG